MSLRTLARSVARRNMEKEGVTKICKSRGFDKNGVKVPSYFSQHWKEYVVSTPTKRRTRS